MKNKYIPYGRQEINQQDIDAVIQVLKSDFLTQGPKVPEFEAKVATKVSAEEAIAVNSATSALHIACLSLGLGPGDVLWTSPITFVASANAALYCGAEVNFVDISPETLNICPKLLRQKLELAKKSNSLPKVVVAVHLAGQSCQMDEIHALSKEFNFSIIEDASHAIGGKYKGKYIGCGEFSDITVFSFHPVKIITTAEGGLITTNSKKLAHKMRLLRSHGITRDKSEMEKYDGDWYYEQIDLGFNYRMTELQAALGISQLCNLDEFVAGRREIAKQYINLLPPDGIYLPKEHSDCYSAYHLFVIQVDPAKRNKIFSHLRSKNIGANVHYIPVHLQPYYKRMGFKIGDFPNSETYYQSAISIPMFPQLTGRDVSYIVESILEVL